MSRSRSLFLGISGGVLIVGLAAIWQARTPPRKPAPLSAPVPAAAVDRSSRAEAPPSSVKAAQPQEAPPAAPDALEEKRRLAAEGERSRIEARERMLAEIDWDAPRPGPPPFRERAVGKREAALSVTEKLEQTERLIGTLKQRILHLRNRPASHSNELHRERVLARLETRVTELETAARGFRESPGEPARPPEDQAPADGTEVHEHPSVEEEGTKLGMR